MNRILWEHGREVVDEIVLSNCSVHLERMSDSSYWMSFTLPDETAVDLNIGSASGRALVEAWVQESDVRWDRNDEHSSPLRGLL